MPFKAGDRVAVIRRRERQFTGTVVKKQWDTYLVEIDGQNVPPKWVHEDRLEALND